MERAANLCSSVWLQIPVCRIRHVLLSSSISSAAPGDADSNLKSKPPWPHHTKCWFGIKLATLRKFIENEEVTVPEDFVLDRYHLASSSWLNSVLRLSTAIRLSSCWLSRYCWLLQQHTNPKLMLRPTWNKRVWRQAAFIIHTLSMGIEFNLLGLKSRGFLCVCLLKNYWLLLAILLWFRSSIIHFHQEKKETEGTEIITATKILWAIIMGKVRKELIVPMDASTSWTSWMLTWCDTNWKKKRLKIFDSTFSGLLSV